MKTKLWSNTATEYEKNSALYSESLIRQELKQAMDTIPEFITTRKALQAMINVKLPRIDEIGPREIRTMNREEQRQRVLYAITPTYTRDTQMVDLMRLKQTLQLATFLHGALIYWIVIEDADSCTQRVRSLLEESLLPYAHLAAITRKRTEEGCVEIFTNGTLKCHRGVFQRNRALELIETIDAAGVIYFADDDNAYSIQLFREIQTVKTVAIFPTGFNGAGNYQRCLVNADGVIVDMFTNYKFEPKNVRRKYPTDMGGMAFTTAILISRKVRLNHIDWPLGTLETNLMNLMVDKMADIQPLGGNCTRVLFWHVKTSESWNNRVEDDIEFELMSKLV